MEGREHLGHDRTHAGPVFVTGMGKSEIRQENACKLESTTDPKTSLTREICGAEKRFVVQQQVGSRTRTARISEFTAAGGYRAHCAQGAPGSPPLPFGVQRLRVLRRLGMFGTIRRSSPCGVPKRLSTEHLVGPSRDWELKGCSDYDSEFR